jgi:NodT family efflux transporter outer membrane factor (OMF) lipoprotein
MHRRDSLFFFGAVVSSIPKINSPVLKYVKSSSESNRTLLTTSRLGAVAFFSLMGLSGCKFVGVDYVAPQMGEPDAWNERIVGSQPGVLAVDYWWKSFEDETLNKLIDAAIETNKSLAIAYERVVQARAARRISNSGLFPSIDGVGGMSRERTSENVGISKAAGGGDTDTFYSVGADVTWELDVLGGVRRSIESADASLEATEESYRDFMVLLIAEVAKNYLDVRTVEERIKLADQNVKNQEGSLKLANDRFDAGLAPKQDITQAQTNLADTQAFLPQLRQQRTTTVNQLSILLGGYSPETEKLLGAHEPIPLPPKGSEIETPAEVLRARPDIRAAERQLAAQTARIGVAEADLYPRFALNGNFALLSNESGDVFDSGSRAYGFGPAFRWNLFSAGRVRSQIDIEESKTREVYLAYENAVLQAVEEVETSMSGIANERDRLVSLKLGSESAKETVFLVKDNYAKGLVDFQNVLDAERTATRVEDSYAVSQGLIAKAYVVLYSALGGGFPDDQDQLTPVK